jgi:anaerobic selenocysteine-containing dehydrogenase
VAHTYQTLLALLPFGRYLGTKNIFSSASLDSHPRMVVSRLLYGNQALIPVPDIERTDHLVIMGANPLVSNGSVMTAPGVKKRLEAIRRRGGRIVVIDPRRTETAAAADRHVFIRPGTDAMLLLAVLHALSRRGAIRAGAGATKVRGLPDLLRLAAGFPPERVAAKTGVDASTIEALAAEFAAARTAVWYGRMGISTQAFGCLSTWLVDAINIVTGNFDRPGGAMFATPAVDLAGLARRLGESGELGRWQSRVGGLPEVNGELPAAAMADEMETPGRGQIRAFLTIAGNPVLSSPNGRRLDRALGGLDFMASIDFYLNETTRHADVILPPTTPLESDHYPLLEYAIGVRNVARHVRALFPRGEHARADWQILEGLAARIGRRRGGLHALAPALARGIGRAVGSGLALDLLLRTGPHRTSLKALARHPHGVDLGPLVPRLRDVIGTADRSVDLYPEALARDVPHLEDALAAGPAPGLSLVGRRTLRSMNSWLDNSPRLVKGPDRCTLRMHMSDASALGLDGADKVEISSRVGAIRAALEVSDEMMPGVVSLPHGWGHDRPGARLSVAERHAGASVNDITDERLHDHVSGTSALDGIPVKVTR